MRRNWRALLSVMAVVSFVIGGAVEPAYASATCPSTTGADPSLGHLEASASTAEIALPPAPSQYVVPVSVSSNGYGWHREINTLKSTIVSMPFVTILALYTPFSIVEVGGDTRGVVNSRGFSSVQSAYVAGIEADGVNAEALAEACGSGANASGGATVEQLTVGGINLATPAPNTFAPLPADQFGTGSYIVANEQIKSLTLTGPTLIADMTVNAVRIHATNAPVVGTTDIILGHAAAHAEMPRLPQPS